MMKLILKSVILFLCIGWLSPVFAGNKKMVEKQTKELDELNKQAVQQLPDLPKDGTIDLKAKVRHEDGEIKFDMVEHQITPKSATSIQKGRRHQGSSTVVQEKAIDLGNKVNTTTVEGEKLENEPNSN
ncbi:MAG: hypothetical protein ACOZF0_23870 [Thermodesulfobacteriota bacterium]